MVIYCKGGAGFVLLVLNIMLYGGCGVLLFVLRQNWLYEVTVSCFKTGLASCGYC